MKKNTGPLDDKTFGLVLGGGGARGAYEVGALKYLFGALPKKLGFMPRFKVICGTSVGALNACGAAAVMDDPAATMERLIAPWRGLRLDSVFEFGIRQLMNLPAWTLANTRVEYSALLDPAPLRRLVRQAIPWENISRNIQSGVVRALTVSCTDLDTGNTVTFVEKTGGGSYPASRDTRRAAVGTRITPLHALASAAIPFIFPPVPIAGRLYNDGGVRMNTPLSPALRLGSDRVLVLNLRRPGTSLASYDTPPPKKISPNLPYMLGKVLDALLLDHVWWDVDRMERVNALIRAGLKEYGEGYLAHLNQTIGPMRGRPYRLVDSVLISPSEDLGHMAVQAVNSSGQFARAVSMPALAMKALAGRESSQETDAISYLLFDGRYVDMLIDLGFRDAQRTEDKLVAFFTEKEI